MVRKQAQKVFLLVFLIVFGSLSTSCVTPASPIRTSTPVAASTQIGQATVSPPAPAPAQTGAASAVPAQSGATATPNAATCSAQSESRAVRPDVGSGWEKLGPLPCYDLTLDLSKADSGTYVGTEKLTFTNSSQSGLSDLVFRLYPNAAVLMGGSMDITSADFNGVPVTPQSLLKDNTAYRLPLPQPLEPGETTVVNLAFEGQAPSNFGGGQTYGIFNLDTSIPVLTLADWYPLLADLKDGQWQYSEVVDVGDAVTSQTALFAVRIAAPDAWKIATTGVSASTSSGDGQAITTFVSGPVRDFMIVASPKFSPETTTWQGIEIIHWRLPNTMNDVGALAVAQESMQIYTNDFGPYPFTQFDMVDVPLQNASGVEYPGLILVQNSLYASSKSLDYLKVVIAHETAHQWWYSVVGNNVLTAPWQDEAMATFSSFLYFQQYNNAYYQGMVRSFQQQVQAYEQKHTQNAIDQPVTAFINNENGYSTLVYLKGSLFFVALQQRLGDQVFFDALQNYYANSMYKLVQPSVLLSSFEHSCDCDLSSFYKEWGVIP